MYCAVANGPANAHQPDFTSPRRIGIDECELLDDVRTGTTRSDEISRITIENVVGEVSRYYGSAHHSGKGQNCRVNVVLIKGQKV